MTRGAHCAFVSGFHRFSFAGEIGKTFPSSIFSEFIGWFWNKIKKIKKIVDIEKNLFESEKKSNKSNKSDFWPALSQTPAAAQALEIAVEAGSFELH